MPTASKDCVFDPIADTDVCEPGLAGWTIYIDANGNNALDEG